MVRILILTVNTTKNRLRWNFRISSHKKITAIPYAQKVLENIINEQLKELEVQRNISYSDREEIRSGTLVLATVQSYVYCNEFRGGVSWKLFKLTKLGEPEFSCDIPEDEEGDEIFRRSMNTEATNERDVSDEGFDDDIPF